MCNLHQESARPQTTFIRSFFVHTRSLVAQTVVHAKLPALQDLSTLLYVSPNSILYGTSFKTFLRLRLFERCWHFTRNVHAESAWPQKTHVQLDPFRKRPIPLWHVLPLLYPIELEGYWCERKVHRFPGRWIWEEWSFRIYASIIGKRLSATNIHPFSHWPHQKTWIMISQLMLRVGSSLFFFPSDIINRKTRFGTFLRLPPFKGGWNFIRNRHWESAQPQKK